MVDMATIEDTCVTMVVAPDITSVETTVTSESVEVTSEPEVAGLAAAAEEVGVDDVGSGAGGDVDNGSPFVEVEGGDVVGCGSVGVDVGIGLEEDVVVNDVVGAVAAAAVAGTR